jgi:hypothetical protein
MIRCTTARPSAFDPNAIPRCADAIVFTPKRAARRPKMREGSDRCACCDGVFPAIYCADARPAGRRDAARVRVCEECLAFSDAIRRQRIDAM